MNELSSGHVQLPLISFLTQSIAALLLYTDKPVTLNIFDQMSCRPSARSSVAFGPHPQTPQENFRNVNNFNN